MTRPKDPRRQAIANTGSSDKVIPDALPPSVSTEDYLERIDALIEQKGFARSVDIAASLSVSQPSVTAMVQRLAESGYLTYERYRGICLTDRGRQVARVIRDRHAALQRVLSLLGVDPETQERDIEVWEHGLSPGTLAALADLSDFLESHPEVRRSLERFRSHRSVSGPSLSGATPGQQA